jgi:tetratricopeptide (TPR) repeat protein
LASDAEERPESLGQALEQMRGLGLSSPMQALPEEEFVARFERAYENPGDPDAIYQLINAADEGIEAERVASSLERLTDALDLSAIPEDYGIWCDLQLKAAGLFESRAMRPDQAERIYRALLEDTADDANVLGSLKRVLKAQSKHEEIVELLLESSEDLVGSSRAELFEEIGELYAQGLKDIEQALVAFVEAFAAAPFRDDLARRIEKLAGTSAQAWEETLSSLGESIDVERDADERWGFLCQIAF